MAIHHEILGLIESFIITHPFLTIFTASFISEELLVFLAILSGRGILSFFMVFFIGIVGILCFDSVIFFIGKSKIGSYIEDRFFPQKKIDEKINFIQKKRNLIYLIATKFIWGTRIASIFYYSVQGMRYRRFFAFDSIALFIWASIMLSAGWLAGKGFENLLRFARNFERFLLLVFITFLVILAINWLIKKMLVKEVNFSRI